MGLTEETDAFVVIVSEETGRISVAEQGVIISGLTPEELRHRLSGVLSDHAVPAGGFTQPKK